MYGSALQGSAEHEKPLHRALERLRLEGAVFLRAEYTEGWALDGQGGPAFAGMLHPGAQRVILFHVVASGRCWLSLADGERHWAGAVAVPRWCAATCTPRTRCSIPGFALFRRCSWCDRPRALPRAGSKPTSRTRLRSHPVGDPRSCPGGCRSCCSWRCCGFISPRLPQWSAAGWRHSEIRCSRRRWPCSMPHPSGSGRWRSWPPGLRYRVPCLTVASGRSLGGRRSAISPSGECTSPRSC